MLPKTYIKSYTSISDAIAGLDKYFRFYNQERLHQSLGYLPPAVIHFR